MKKEDLIKKIKLDNFEELEKFFEISAIKEEANVAREIRRRIADKFDYMIGILNSFLHPEATIIELKDADSLTDSDRNMIEGLLRELTIIIKQHQILELDPDEIKEKDFFKASLSAYKKIMPQIVKLISKTKETLLKVEGKTEGIHYLG